MNVSASARARGRWAEQLAADTLAGDGLEILARNYQCRWGEIDLVMRDADTTVFVEVRYRTSVEYGSAAESVSRRKQMRLLSTAEHFLQRHPTLLEQPCRFDVVSVHPPQAVTWLTGAFEG